MHDTPYATLARWANFYLLAGSAAAALTGLQFVVQTLLSSELIRPEGDFDAEGGIAAFGTPTVVHFSLALILSAMICVPWPSYEGLRVTLGLIGAGALVYAGVVIRRARNQRSYVPTAYDYVAHVALPALAYAAVLVAAVILNQGAEWVLFLVAGATLLLICVGIHNAWDTVTYLMISALRAVAASKSATTPSGSDDQGTTASRST
jgi:hypothetical protein